MTDDNDNASKKSKIVLAVLKIILALGIIALLVLNTIANDKKLDQFTLALVLAVMLILFSTEFSELSIGKLLSMSKTVGATKDAVEKSAEETRSYFMQFFASISNVNNNFQTTNNYLFDGAQYMTEEEKIANEQENEQDSRQEKNKISREELKKFVSEKIKKEKCLKNEISYDKKLEIPQIKDFISIRPCFYDGYVLVNDKKEYFFLHERRNHLLNIFCKQIVHHVAHHSFIQFVPQPKRSLVFGFCVW